MIKINQKRPVIRNLGINYRIAVVECITGKEAKPYSKSFV